MSKNTGGPAFPLKEPLTRDSEGMTLRDYFAAKAMQAMARANNSNPNTIAVDANTAYCWADQMLKARAQ